MTLDTKKYGMLAFDGSNPPTCKGCDGNMVRIERDGLGEWVCTDWECDAYPETDAQLDDRLTLEAEHAYERQQAMGGGSFLSPDAMQRSLKR